MVLLPMAAFAQSTSEDAAQAALLGLPAITVTAEKIEQSLTDVAASVAVLDGDEINDSAMDGLTALEGRVPGLAFQPFGQAGLNSPVMRGLTANFNAFSTSTLLLVDGVPTLTAQGFDDALLDIDRIEVLRGPQSTLYGRNAEAGVIAVHSQPMDNQQRARVVAGLGSRDRQDLRLSLSQPLVEDRLYASVSASWQQQDGFIDNTASGQTEDDRERRHLKLGLRWTPTAATDLVLRYAREDYDDGAALWGAPTAKRAEVASGTPSWNRSQGQSLSLNASQQLASGLTLHAITAWSEFADDVQQDTDFMPADLLHIRRDHQLRTLSQELRLEGQWGMANWLAGVYADRSDNDLNTISRRMGVSEQTRVDQQSDTLALFSHWNLALSERWQLGAGARLERNRVEIEPQGSLRQHRDWTHLSPKLALQYRFSPAHQGYFSLSRGVRAGGFNVLSASSGFSAFAPEKVWSLEAGLKGELAGQRLRYSLAAYRMQIDDMQVVQMPMPAVMYITSAASATSNGLELDLDYLLGSHWQLSAGLAWNRTRFDDFQDGSVDYSGQRNPFAPELTGHLGVRYDASAGWYAQARLLGSSKMYLDAANDYRRNGYGLINLAAGYPFGRWEVSAYVNNLADQRYDAVGYQNGFVTVYSPPREAGLRLSWQL